MTRPQDRLASPPDIRSFLEIPFSEILAAADAKANNPARQWDRQTLFAVIARLEPMRVRAQSAVDREAYGSPSRLICDGKLCGVLDAMNSLTAMLGEQRRAQ